jgi:hypothetical protein
MDLLAALRDQTNPRQLRDEIYDLLDYIATLPCAVPGITEDVRQTMVTTLTPEPEGELPSHSSRGHNGKNPRKEGTRPVTLSFEGAIPLR